MKTASSTPAPKYAISLYTALALTGYLDDDDEVIYLAKGETIPRRPNIFVSLKTVKETYDMQKVRVINICPYFCCDEYGEEYKGLLFTII